TYVDAASATKPLPQLNPQKNLLYSDQSTPYRPRSHHIDCRPTILVLDLYDRWWKCALIIAALHLLAWPIQWHFSWRFVLALRICSSIGPASCYHNYSIFIPKQLPFNLQPTLLTQETTSVNHQALDCSGSVVRILVYGPLHCHSGYPPCYKLQSPVSIAVGVDRSMALLLHYQVAGHCLNVLSS
ncbi:hypothetical protein KI387_023639, partial [Taxus chinensis]